jgi:hypothetical protein
VTVDKEVRILSRLVQQSAPEGEELSDVFFPGRNHVSVALVDDVVEAKLELCMLAKGAKYLGHRPFRIQNREDVTDLRVAVTGQLLDTS